MQIAITNSVLPTGMVLFSGSRKKWKCFLEVSFNSVGVTVHRAELVLGFCITGVSSFLQLFDCGFLTQGVKAH